MPYRDKERKREYFRKYAQDHKEETKARVRRFRNKPVTNQTEFETNPVTIPTIDDLRDKIKDIETGRRKVSAEDFQNYEDYRVVKNIDEELWEG